VPIPLEDVLVEETDTAIAEAHGRWGKAIDVSAVQKVVLQLLCRDQVWRFAIELSQQADLTDIGLLSTLPLATELQGGNHLLTQWGHKISPFVK
jgi:hypothetical protein